jgi:Leucine-rich repeat (LRR) protein
MRKSLLYIFIMILLSLNLYQEIFAQVLKKDSLALVELYNKTNGKNWYGNDNWLNEDVITWYGIEVVDNRVIGINLNNNNLSGEIPGSISNLDFLQYLILSDNKIYGKISVDLCYLSNLLCLTIDNNQLNGNIPSEIIHLKNLRTLWLSENNLSGAIPTELNGMSNLVSVLLENNKFSPHISTAK